MNLEEMWERLTQHQPYADRRGYGPEWAAMCAEKTEAAAEAAAEAKAAAGWAARAEAAAAAWAAAEAAAAEAETAVDWIKRAEGEK